MVSSNERDGNSEKPRAACEAVFVVMLVAQDVVDTANASDDAGEGQSFHPDFADADPAIFSSVRLQSNGAQLVSPACSEQVEPHRGGSEQGYDESEIRRRAMKCG